MTALRLGAVVAFVEAQQRLTTASHAFSDALDARRDAENAMRDAWDAMSVEEQAAVNAAYAPGGVEVTAA